MKRGRGKRRLASLLINTWLLSLLSRSGGGRRLAASSPQGAGGDGLYADAAERERALRYNRQREWLTLFGMGWGALINLVALATGFSAWLRSRSARVAPRWLGPEAPYGLAAALLSSLVSLPLSYYGGWVVEQRYGLSNQTRRAWAGEQVKGTALGLVLGLPVQHGVYYVIRRSPRWWWAILSALTIPFTIILANLAPVLIMPLFNKYEPIRDRALADRIKALAAAQGVTISDVLQMDMSKQTRKANAFFTGVGNTKRIVLGDTLLNEFTADEIEVVLAHELGHQVHSDLWKLIGLGAVTTALTAWAVDRLGGPLIARYGRRFGLDPARGVGDVAALPLLSLLLNALSLVLLPIQNGISRNLIERPADRYALDLTGKHEAFIGAMEKLGRMNLADPQPPLLVKWFLHGHPTLTERIAEARRDGAAAR